MVHGYGNGARNLADHDRYNLLPAVAEMMKLDTSRNGTLWKDKALIELNVAVLHSFKNKELVLLIVILLHNNFSNLSKKAACGRVVTGNWVWLIPPLSPATTHIYHKPYPNEILKPNFFHK